MPEIQLLVSDFRAIQKMDSHINKRFCTIQYFGRKDDGTIGDVASDRMLLAAETVIDIQGTPPLFVFLFFSYYPNTNRPSHTHTHTLLHPLTSEDFIILVGEMMTHPQKFYPGGSKSDPRRMVPIDTKIGLPSNLSYLPPTIPSPKLVTISSLRNGFVPSAIMPQPRASPVHHFATNVFIKGESPAPVGSPDAPPENDGAWEPTPTRPKQPPSGPSRRMKNKVCEMCGKTQSPEWRKGPSGEKSLCNACGLKYARSVKRKNKLAAAAALTAAATTVSPFMMVDDGECDEDDEDDEEES